ncbi:unnamed protein product, partial [Ixodes persulcatus]
RSRSFPPLPSIGCLCSRRSDAPSPGAAASRSSSEIAARIEAPWRKGERFSPHRFPIGTICVPAPAWSSPPPCHSARRPPSPHGSRRRRRSPGNIARYSEPFGVPPWYRQGSLIPAASLRSAASPKDA